jgi:hypothetical protein
MSRIVRSMAGLGVLVLASGLCMAQEPPKIDPRADQVLKAMSNVLGSAKQLSVHNDATSDERITTGELVEMSASIDLVVRRPDAIHAVVAGDLRPMRYWIGSGRVTVLDESRWTYATASVARDLDVAIDQMWDRYGIKIPLVDFVSNNPYQDLTRDVEAGYYAGMHSVDGVSCHHLVFSQEDIDWQIWIEDGLLPLPRKLTIRYKTEPGAPRYTAMLSEWDLSPDLGDALFEFVPPGDAEQIPFAESAPADREE